MNMATNRSNPTPQNAQKLKILNSCIRLWPAASSNTINSSSNYDRENAIAIGYIAQAVNMLATILAIPLRYPIIYRGSKSYIIEQVGSGGGAESRMFALFRQASAHEEHFFYAVNLLNANLAQIRVLLEPASHRSIDNSDLLVNLKWIFDYFNK